MRKIKLGLIIIPLIIIVTLVGINTILPEPLSDSLDFWNITPKDNIEYISDELYVKDKKFFVYSALNSNIDSDNDFYIIAVGDITGLKSNKYSIISYREIEDSQLTVTEYSEKMNVSNFPEIEVKNRSEYQGSIYVGTVPSTCSSVLVNDTKAEMVKQEFQLNGKDVDFYLYYCALENEDEVNLTISDENGTDYYVTSVEKDGLMYPHMEIIQ